MPEEEWFCRDCFIDRSQDNTQELDTIDYSQHAIAFSDEEMPTFEPQSLAHAGNDTQLRTQFSLPRATDFLHI